jgi:hypothetical protein
MSHPLSNRKNSAAFTLIEMLVSVAVIILIMTFISQMMNSTMISTTLSGRHLDTDSEARLVFDRMAVDFARMSRRTDVDFIFSKQPDPEDPLSGGGPGSSGSNDKMFFYSEAPAYYAPSTSGSSYDSTVALVGYSVNTSENNPLVPPYSLLRLSKGLSLNSSAPGSNPGGMLFLTTPAPGSTPIPANSLPGAQGQPNFNGAIGFNPDYEGTDLSDYDVLSPEVIRMEFCFQVKDLTNPNAPGTAYSNYPVAYFQSSANNTRSIGTPPTNPVPNFTSHPFVGDRYYDPEANRAYVCTGFTTVQSGPSTSGTVPIWTPNGMADVTAIVVAIAILDQNSRKLISTTQLASISAALSDPTEGIPGDTNPQTDLLPPAGVTQSTATLPEYPHLMAQTWENAIDSASPTFASTAGIPQTVAAQIRVYQRFFYLNNN